MYELSQDMKVRVAKYEPITIDGLTLYPIKVSEYDDFMIARQSMTFLAQTLPIELMSRPLLESFYKMDIQSYAEGKTPSGMFMSAVLSLCLALRISPNAPMNERLQAYQLVVDQNDSTRLKAIRFSNEDGKQWDITPTMYARMRTVISIQNGVDPPSETANPELLQAERDLAESKSLDLDFGIENLIRGAALITGTDESDVYEWPILKLHNRIGSFKRLLDYSLCSIAESNGATWKGGNPCPDPWFKRSEGSKKHGLMPLEDFANGEGIKAVQQSGGADLSDLPMEEQQFTQRSEIE